MGNLTVLSVLLILRLVVHHIVQFIIRLIIRMLIPHSSSIHPYPIYPPFLSSLPSPISLLAVYILIFFVRSLFYFLLFFFMLTLLYIWEVLSSQLLSIRVRLYWEVDHLQLRCRYKHHSYHFRQLASTVYP